MEIEELEFVAAGGGDLRDFVPSTGDSVEEKREGNEAASEVEQELGDVGPNDGFHAAFEGVENREGNDDEDGETLGSTEGNADDQGDGGNTHAFGQSARAEKGQGGDSAHFCAETSFDNGVGGEEFAAKIAGKEYEGNQEAADDVAENELEESEIGGIGERGSADDGERGGFGGDDREG